MSIRINVAPSAGFCFGVRRAIKIAFQTARTKKNVQMLGDIVHNEQVVESIARAGIKSINKLTRGTGKTLLIRAHGTSQDTLAKARRLRYQIVDATCPMVKEIHRTAVEAQKKGYALIVLGDKKHDEVRGIVGQLKSKVTVINPLKDVSRSVFKNIRKAAIVVQSTQDEKKVLATVAHLEKYIPEMVFFNTICRPTKIKQSDIRHLPATNDVMIVIGSKRSANTQRLYEIAKTLNPRTFRVGSEKELRGDWFKSAHSVGVTTGASTPEETTSKVIKRICSLCLRR